MRVWFTREWWRYLLTGATGFRHILCRARGHPSGTVFYNAGGLEPDMRCKNCPNDLG